MSNENIDLSLQYLQVELARIELLVRRNVLCWQLAGQDPHDEFRGLHLSDAHIHALLNRPFGTSWGQLVKLAPEEAQVFADTMAQITAYASELQQRAADEGHSLRLEYLRRTFGLTPFDYDTFLVCLAPALDSKYEKIYSYLQDDVTRKRPTVNLVLDLLSDPGPARLLALARFTDDAPLFKHRLLEATTDSTAGSAQLLGQILSPDKTVIHWLLGEYKPGANVQPYVNLTTPTAEETHTLLTETIRRTLTVTAEIPPVFVFYGPDKMLQATAAAFFAHQHRQPLLTVDLAGLTTAGLTPLMALQLALRDARLTGAVPFLSGWDAVMVEGIPPLPLLDILFAYPGVVIVAGEQAWHPHNIERERNLVWLDFPIPNFAQRYALWRHYLSAQHGHEMLEVTDLAGQFLLTGGQIRDAVATAGDIAAQRGQDLQRQHLFHAARTHSNPHLSGLARKIEPRYTWDDIILPTDQLALLHEIVATVRGRATVMEVWSVGNKLAASKGITTLFDGPPGTGKTMAAEVIANDLNLDLYKIDLSTVVSKYIGETEKNLERIFSEAQSSNAILFFDEADALFGKRSEVKDAHDRYANIETSYLLQRMEAYDGVTILSTNLRANLDEAFTRRLQFAVDIPFPEEEYRLRIWTTLFPPDVLRTADLDFRLLAHRFKLAGGNIRNIIVAAAFLAAAAGSPVTMQHLLHAARRELQKMGRLVNEADMVIPEPT
ncbi:MAG TPA: AAA family ATPase [Anaerolineae bacterium]|nr:AAA family ATPase [Anaerolineae bacterium]HQH37967.1 AAA family ATPase [Anaerolineae bacterium]